MKKTILSRLSKLARLLSLTAVLLFSYVAESSVFNPVDAYLYPDNMTMVIQLRDGSAIVDTAEVAAFIGEECRCASRAIKGLYYLLIPGEGVGQPISLRTCLNGAVVTIDDTLLFASDAAIGTPKEPYIIDLQNLTTDTSKGDANRDGTVSTADIVTIMALISQLSLPSSSPLEGSVEAADVNGDGKVDIADIIAVINMIK